MVKLVAGKMPDQSSPDQVLASFTLQRDAGVRVGTVIWVPFVAPSQRNAVPYGADLIPTGPTITFHVVGIEAAAFEFPSSGGSTSYDLYGTQALARSLKLLSWSRSVAI